MAEIRWGRGRGVCETDKRQSVAEIVTFTLDQIKGHCRVFSRKLCFKNITLGGRDQEKGYFDYFTENKVSGSRRVHRVMLQLSLKITFMIKLYWTLRVSHHVSISAYLCLCEREMYAYASIYTYIMKTSKTVKAVWIELSLSPISTHKLVYVYVIHLPLSPQSLGYFEATLCILKTQTTRLNEGLDLRYRWTPGFWLEQLGGWSEHQQKWKGVLDRASLSRWIIRNFSIYWFWYVYLAPKCICSDTLIAAFKYLNTSLG